MWCRDEALGGGHTCLDGKKYKQEYDKTNEFLAADQDKNLPGVGGGPHAHRVHSGALSGT